MTGSGLSAWTVCTRLALLDLPEATQRAIVAKQMGVVDGYRLAVEMRQKARPRPLGAPKSKNTKAGRRFQASQVPTFNAHHNLAPTAAGMCITARHSEGVRIGPACGPCWEQTIREDERAKVMGQAVAS